MKIAIVILGMLSIVGCRAADWADVTTLGKSGHVTCYSGGQKIYEGDSDGQIANEQHSDGFQFVDAATHSLIVVSGNCVIRY